MESEELIPFLCANISSFPFSDLPQKKKVYFQISFYLHIIAPIQLPLFILIPHTLVSAPYVSPLLLQCLPHSPILHHQIKFLKEFWFCCVSAQISSRMLHTGYSNCGRQTNAL